MRHMSIAILGVWLAACQTSEPVETLAPSGPPKVGVLARDATVTTEHGAAPVATVEIHDVFSRGARTRLLVETVAAPRAVAVLFAGGKGALAIDEAGGIGWGKGNFLIRARTYFLRHGFTAVSIDAPSDHAGNLGSFRGTAAHATDIGAVIAHLRERYKVPVWLVGTSRGTLSAANAAARLRVHRPDGIVLTSSMLATGADSLFDFALEAIALPVLVTHHRADGCWATPPGGVEPLARKLTAAKPLAVRWYAGGEDRGDPCQARGHHGYAGIEETVVADIAAWIAAPR